MRTIALIVLVILAALSVALLATANPVEAHVPISVGHVPAEPLAFDVDTYISHRAPGHTVVDRVQTARTVTIVATATPTRVWTCGSPEGLLSDDTATVRRCEWVVQ